MSVHYHHYRCYWHLVDLSCFETPVVYNTLIRAEADNLSRKNSFKRPNSPLLIDLWWKEIYFFILSKQWSFVSGWRQFKSERSVWRKEVKCYQNNCEQFFYHRPHYSGPIAEYHARWNLQEFNSISVIDHFLVLTLSGEKYCCPNLFPDMIVQLKDDQ